MMNERILSSPGGSSEGNEKKSAIPLLISVCAVCMYFLCDPTLEWAYPLYCTYRIQTIVRILRAMIRYAVLILCVCQIIFFKKEKIPLNTGAALPFLAVYAGYLLSCILSSGTENLAHWYGALLTALTPMLIFQLVLSQEEDRVGFLRILALCYFCLAVLNLLFFFFPQLYIGEAKEWREDFFLGSKNRTGWPLLLGAFFVLLDAKNGRNVVELLLYLALLLANLLITKAVTFAIGTLVLLFLLLPPMGKLTKRVDLSWFILAYALVFLVCMFFLEPLLRSRLSIFLLDALGKDSTLSERTVLWKTAVELILQHPLLGVGFQESSGFIPHTNPYGTTYHHGHNEILQTWYEGGAVTVLLAFLMLFYIAYRLRKCEDQELAVIGKAVLFSFILMLSADLIPYCCWYMLFFIGNALLLLAEPAPAGLFPFRSLRQKKYS